MKSFINRSMTDSEKRFSNSFQNQHEAKPLVPVMVDNRVTATAQRQLISSINSQARGVQLATDEELLQGRFTSIQRTEDELMLQKKENRTGLPEGLKKGMESLSGYSLDHVKVHYNSNRPAAVNAHAYAQGADIHLAGGQEKHLAHELGHVVQQMEGRVKATTNIAGLAVNDNPALEREATVMGERALQFSAINSPQNLLFRKQADSRFPLQRVIQLAMDAGNGEQWHIHHGHIKLGNLTRSRVEFNGRAAKEILKELGEKINRHKLSISGALEASFRECINYIKANC